MTETLYYCRACRRKFASARAFAGHKPYCGKGRPPVVFLDMDGVLCTQRAHAAYSKRTMWRHLDPIACRLVEKLCEKAKALLVLSSTWRQHIDQSAMTLILMNGGFSDVRWHQNWKTPILGGVQRGLEIQSWLNCNGNPDYLILDDDADMLPDQQARFVQTDCYDGFLWKHYVAACKALEVKL